MLIKGMNCILKFEEKHIKKCSNIYPNIFNSEPWNENWSVETAYNRLKDIYDSPKFKGLVYIDNGKILGAILGNIECWDKGFKYFLKEFFIDNNCQGRGIGSSMIDFMENELKKINVNSIELYTLRGRQTEGFYKKNGYEKSCDTIIMNKVCT